MDDKGENYHRTGPDRTGRRLPPDDYRPPATGDVATATAVVDGPIGDEGVSVIVNGMEWNGMEWNGMEWNGMNPPTTMRLT